MTAAITIPSRSRGFTLVELMVGMALGLIVTSLGLAGLAAHLRESRALASEARVMQDLRAAADAIARSARRAGVWHEAALYIGQGLTPEHSDWQVDDTQVHLRYQRAANEAAQHFGYRLRRGVVEVQIGASGWQALTDDSSIVITHLQLQPRTVETSLASLCVKACSDDAADCPRLEQRQLALHLEGHARHDSTLRRALTTAANVRNDRLVGVCPT